VAVTPQEPSDPAPRPAAGGGPARQPGAEGGPPPVVVLRALGLGDLLTAV
jgi:hypothetical protein